MITLAFSVLIFYFFSQVTQLSGFGGVNNLDLPGAGRQPGARPGAALLHDARRRRWSCSSRCKYVSRTPFGLSLQGLRDEPARMRALGFDVTRHRMLAFTLAALVAGIAGLLSVWYNRRISPGSINLEQTINILIIAVVGGLYRLEGAWVGALVYALIDNYSREWVPDVGQVLGPARFNTIIGLVFLVIVLLSPGGIVGLWEQGRDRSAVAGEAAATPGGTVRTGGGGHPRSRHCQVTWRGGVFCVEGTQADGAVRRHARARARRRLRRRRRAGGRQHDRRGEHAGRGRRRRHDQGRVPVGLRGRVRLVLRAHGLRLQPGADPRRRRQARRREADRRRRRAPRSATRRSRSSATAARTTPPTRRSRRPAA